LVKQGLGPWHSRATIGTGRANSLENGWFFWLDHRHDHATTGMGRATTGMGRDKLLVMLGSIFFIFSHHIWTNTYKTN